MFKMNIYTFGRQILVRAGNHRLVQRKVRKLTPTVEKT